MCPELKEGLCMIASIELKKIACADEHCGTSNEWDRCRVYISQFFSTETRAFSEIA